MPPIQRPPNDGSGGGDEKKSPLERYLEKQKKTREPKPPRATLETRRGGVTRPSAPVPPAAPSVAPPVSAPIIEEPSSKLAARRPEAATRPPRDPSLAPEPVGADVFSRFVAAIVDGVAILCLQWPVGKVVIGALALVTGAIGAEARLGLELLISYVVIFFYYGTFYSTKGASPGKMLMGLEIYDEGTGRHMTPTKAFLREAIGKLVSAIPFFVGYFVALFRDDRRALHDLLFDTRVVRNIRSSKTGIPR